MPSKDRRSQQRRKRRFTFRKTVARVLVLTPQVPRELPTDPADRIHQQRLHVHLPQPRGARELQAFWGLLASRGVKGDLVPGVTDAEALWQQARLWSDASGHFDLWDGKAVDTGKVLHGRWDGADADGKQPGVVVFGAAASPWVAKGPGGRWTFDDGRGVDASNGARHGARMVQATGHFVDDWQGETAFLAGQSAQVRFGTAKDEYTVGAADGGFAKADRVKYGQCWVFAGLASGKEAAESREALSTAEVFAAYQRDGGGLGQCDYGKCFCASFVGDALLRNLGIPTRSQTNFDSAHESRSSLPAGVGPMNRALVRVQPDGQGFAVLDFAAWAKRLLATEGPYAAPVRIDVQPDGRIYPKSTDAIWNFHVWNTFWSDRQKSGASTLWNFHVWNEAWSRGSFAGIDATPQESPETSKVCNSGRETLDASTCGLTGTPYVLFSSAPPVRFAFAPHAKKGEGGDRCFCQSGFGGHDCGGECSL